MIKSINIKNFMAHKAIEQTDIPYMNVFIGRNDTGKTGLLKLLYATAKTLEVYSLKRKSGNGNFKKELSEKLYDTFMPRKQGLGDLVQKGASEKLHAEVTLVEPKYKQQVYFNIGERTERSITDCTEQVETLPPNGMNALFIPAKEVLTAFNDIRAMRENFYGAGFDDTYLDLIKALSLQTTKGRVADELSQINKGLADLFDGVIQQTKSPEQPFEFKRRNQRFAMQQTAEGIKKIGILTTLINNRQLTKETVLFMDEPETALHPNAIRQLMEMLVGMSKAGVQIFLATHSYFVLKQLSLCAQRDNFKTWCWSLERRAEGQLVETSIHDLSSGILPDNSIVNEALDMYNDDLKLNLGL